MNSAVYLEFHEEYAGTYFLDAREPEPEELNSLLSEPLTPPGNLTSFMPDPTLSGLLFMTTDNLPNVESYAHLVKLKRKENGNAPNNTSHGVHTFVKIHTIQNLNPDDALGSMFLRYSTAGAPIGDISALSGPLSSTSLDSSTNGVSLMNRCLAKCMRDCNQLTWFHFRNVMPCAVTSLAYRLVITDDVVQIICSGVAVSPSSEEAPLFKCVASPGSSKSEGLKAAMSNTKKSIFNLPKGFRSGTAIELKSVAQTNEFEYVFSEQLAVKTPPKKAKWWKTLSKDVTSKRSVGSTGFKPTFLLFLENLKFSGIFE